jgi:hypothetical protein
VATATVTITSAGTTAGNAANQSTKDLFAEFWFVAQGTGVFGAIIIIGGARRNKIRSAYFVLLIAASSLLTGCSIGTAGTHQSGTPPGTYTILITGSTGNLQHSTSLVLTVQ